MRGDRRSGGNSPTIKVLRDTGCPRRDFDLSLPEEAASPAMGAIPVSRSAVNRNNRMESKIVRQLP
jgi:hypothetical protein